MDIFVSELTNAFVLLLSVVISGVASYLALYIKKWLRDKIDTEEKRDIVNTTVKYVEQIYTDVHGRDKLEMAIQTAEKFLNKKGIKVSRDELEFLIEAAVNTFNSELGASEEVLMK